MSLLSTVSAYLLARLQALGIRHLFGVPGDYNLGFLDHVERTDGIGWIGARNELNAAYAADGYARLHGMAALATVFGPGELSALNGIAGAYAEQAPIVVITGAPSTNVAQRGARVHHTLGDGDFTHFAHIFQQVTAAQATLTPDNAEAEIDRVLQTCWLHKRPVQIILPLDVAEQPLPLPESPLILPTFTSNPAALAEFVARTLGALDAARHPVILADYKVNRYQLNAELRALVDRSGLPIASLSMGKGVVDETHPQFIGVYSGVLSDASLKCRIEAADCLLCIGVRFNDFTSGGFTQHLPVEHVIELHPDSAHFNQALYPQLAMADVLTQLASRVTPRPVDALDLRSLHDRSRLSGVHTLPEASGSIGQLWFWQRLGQLLRPGDVLLADVGTAFGGAMLVPLPPRTTFISQPLWASLGYTLPALLGTTLAAPDRRHILVIGDGALQMTVQELSSLVAYERHAIVLLLNNDDYTIERLIHGPEQRYNDIPRWHYGHLLEAFGGAQGALPLHASTEAELDAALSSAEGASDKLVFIEVVMAREDGPPWLHAFSKLLAEEHHYSDGH
jgi:TPP-dependent 2-oxoacid decarboxylase